MRAQAVAEVRQLVLVVDDDDRLRKILQLMLRDQGFDTIEATSGESAVDSVLQSQPALVLLDLGLPDFDGIEVTLRIRERSRVPILVLTVRADEQSIEDALDAGANDYVTKPFREKELFARLRACLRDAPAGSGSSPIALDVELRLVTVDGRRVRLSTTECKLLSTLLRAGGKVVTHQQLLRAVWGGAHTQDAGYLRVYMHHLREKLELEPANPRWLLTEPGVGYRLAWE
ncbi:MAG TPA: response regulator transcription factor [Polyangiaceae bacterium]|nr:response regulator transcription factor [Polyangiaceae bacterium]